MSTDSIQQDGNKSNFSSEQRNPAIVQQVHQKVSQILTRDEQILYIATQGSLTSLSPDSVVLTSRRFIVYKPKLLGGAEFKDYIWRDLVDITLKEGMMHSTLSMKTVEGKVITVENIPKAQARKVYSYAQEMEEQVREERRIREMEEKRAAAGGITIQQPAMSAPPPPSTPPPPQDDPVKKLTQLKQMLDAGLITQGEYDTKKADLLSRM